VLVGPSQEEVGPQPRVYLQEEVAVLTPRSQEVMIQEPLVDLESPVHSIRPEHRLN
jgi:hypothetical protein